MYVLYEYVFVCKYLFYNRFSTVVEWLVTMDRQKTEKLLKKKILEELFFTKKVAYIPYKVVL